MSAMCATMTTVPEIPPRLPRAAKVMLRRLSRRMRRAAWRRHYTAHPLRVKEKRLIDGRWTRDYEATRPAE